VLVPQVYVRLKPGDINGGGGVLGANQVQIGSSGSHANNTRSDSHGSANVINGGTIAGRALGRIGTNHIHSIDVDITRGASNEALNANQDITTWVASSVRGRALWDRLEDRFWRVAH
jgi:filamentous hemagglutinin